jgi:hypothetical protein
MSHTATLSAIPVRNASQTHRSDRHSEQAAIPNDIGELAKEGLLSSERTVEIPVLPLSID